MKSMKKILALVLVLTMALTLMVGCGGKTETAAPAASESEASIAAGSQPVAVPDFTSGRWLAPRPDPARADFEC